MCVTALVSMWMNNSAATSIMMPAALAIVHEIENYDKKIAAERQQNPEVILPDIECHSHGTIEHKRDE